METFLSYSNKATCRTAPHEESSPLRCLFSRAHAERHLMGTFLSYNTKATCQMAPHEESSPLWRQGHVPNGTFGDTFHLRHQGHLLNGTFCRHLSLTVSRHAERYLPRDIFSFHAYATCRMAPMENPLSFRHLCQLLNNTHYCSNTFSTYNSACIQ